MRLQVGAAAALIACGAVATGLLAQASDGASRVAVLPAGSQILGYQLAADSAGAATLVWSTASFVDDYAGSMIRVSEQNAQGKWSVPVQLGGVHQSLNPVLGESGSGAAAIVWSYVQGSRDPRTVLEAVTRSSPNAAWSAPLAVWSIRGAYGALATAGIDSAGIATIIWTRYGPYNPAIWRAEIDTRRASATTPQELVAAGMGGTDVTLAVNGPGAALVSWQHEIQLTAHKNALPTVHAAEMAIYRTATGRWLVPQQLSTFAYQQEPEGTQIWQPSSPPSVVTSDGTAATTWPVDSSGNEPLEISTRNPETGAWSTVRAPDSTGAFDATVAAGPHGSLLAFWEIGYAGSFRSASSANGRRWSTPIPVVVPHNSFTPFLASNPNGSDALAFDAPRSNVMLATRAASHGWAAPKLVGVGYDPEASASSNGYVTVAWEHGVDPHDVIETRTFH